VLSESFGADFHFQLEAADHTQTIANRSRHFEKDEQNGERQNLMGRGG
jgi:hypothetical protein